MAEGQRPSQPHHSTRHSVGTCLPTARLSRRQETHSSLPPSGVKEQCSLGGLGQCLGKTPWGISSALAASPHSGLGLLKRNHHLYRWYLDRPHLGQQQ